MKIEIFKPFGEAFELTKKILFQPFDLRKWCVIGFAAFLTHLGSGGFNFKSRGNIFQRPELQNIKPMIEQIPVWILVLGGSMLALLAIAVMIVFAWLRARGYFIFTNCIVKNRGVIAVPWREFHREGNSYFVFSLLVGCGMFIFGALTALPFFLPIVRGVTFLHLHDVYLISMIVLWIAIVILLIVAWGLLSHFMVAVMYRRRCRASEAFRAAVSLIANYPGEITLYCLFWIVLAMGAAAVACLTMCATCCMALIPYVGTVILLPIFVCLRSFGLLFLRQFGPEYDVWATSRNAEPPPLP